MPQPLLSKLSCLLKFLHRVTVFRCFFRKICSSWPEWSRKMLGGRNRWKTHSAGFYSNHLPLLLFLPVTLFSVSLSLNNENTGPVKGDVGLCGPWALQHQYQRVSRRGVDWALKLCLFQQMSSPPQKSARDFICLVVISQPGTAALLTAPLFEVGTRKPRMNQSLG